MDKELAAAPVQVLPFADAIKFIQLSRRKPIGLHVGTWAPFAVQNPNKPDRGTVGSYIIRLSKKEALEFLQAAFPDHWKPKLALTITDTTRCIYVGNSPR